MENDLNIKDPLLQQLLPFLDIKITFDDGYVCLFDLPIGHNFERTNVFKFDLDGNLVWMIEDLRAPEDEDARTFTNIKLIDGKLEFYNWIGARGTVNLENGKLTVPNQKLW
jgi:hypothetical protein